MLRHPFRFIAAFLNLILLVPITAHAHGIDWLASERVIITVPPSNPARTEPALAVQSIPSRQLFGFSATSVAANGVQPWLDSLSVSIPERANPRILNSLILEPDRGELEIKVTGHTAQVRPLAGFEKDQDYTLGIKVRRMCPVGLEASTCATLDSNWLYKLGFRTTSNFAYPLGTSAQGRTIWAHSFGRCRSNNCRKIMLTGALHGSEWRSGDLGRLVGILDTNPQYLAGQDKEVLIIPNTNPDGVARNTRYNARGVNLNRNFPAYWEGCSQCGPYPASEPETQLVVNTTNQFDPDYLISYHAQWPPNGIIFRGSDTNEGTIAFANYAARHTGYPVGYFPDFDVVPGDQTVWAESRGTRSLIIEATYVANSDWAKNWPLYQALLRDSKFR